MTEETDLPRGWRITPEKDGIGIIKRNGALGKLILERMTIRVVGINKLFEWDYVEAATFVLDDEQANARTGLFSRAAVFAELVETARTQMDAEEYMIEQMRPDPEDAAWGITTPELDAEPQIFSDPLTDF